jgi:hypothetical protein
MDDYEDLTACALSDELEHELVHSQSHCVFMWTNKQGEAFGVVQSYLPKDGTLWMTCAETRARVSALRRFPRASVCISGAGTPMTSGRTVTYKGNQGLVLPRVLPVPAPRPCGRRRVPKIPRLPRPRSYRVHTRLQVELRPRTHDGTFTRRPPEGVTAPIES